MRKKYRSIKVNGKKYDEHRYVMEQHLGRKLTFNEVVHHINGDTLDNRIDNLELKIRPDHSKEHMLGHTFSEETRKKLSDAVKRVNANGSRNRRPVALLDKDGKIEKVYISSTETEQDGFSRVHVGKNCIGSIPHHKHRQFRHISIEQFEMLSGRKFFKDEKGNLPIKANQ